jgi:hypothetical protein
MDALELIAYFVAGLFLANGVPHFVYGISGRRFQSPFASPPGVGESRPMVNVLWGLFNFIVGYVLVNQIGSFESGLSGDALALFGGILLAGMGLAWYFERVQKGRAKKPRRR